jgi:polyphosphate kinase
MHCVPKTQSGDPSRNMSEQKNKIGNRTDGQWALASSPSSRNQAILAFNRRVLAQAMRPDVPPLERLRYVCIVSSNIDEFFEVRFADVLTKRKADLEQLSQLAAALLHEQSVVFKYVVMPLLYGHGIKVLTTPQSCRFAPNPTVDLREKNDLEIAQVRWLRRFFHLRIRPALQVLSDLNKQAFSHLPSRALNVLMQTQTREQALANETALHLISLPKTLPRMVEVPAHHPKASPERLFMPLSSVLEMFLPDFFVALKSIAGPPQDDLRGGTVQLVVAHTLFRITRHSELEVDSDDASNLRQALRRGLTTRHLGRAVRLELPKMCPEGLRAQLQTCLDLPDAAVFMVDAPLNLSRFTPLIERVDAVRIATGQASLRFASFEPSWPHVFRSGASMFDVLRQQDVLLHHPFESFEPVEAFLQAAAQDPHVLSIQQTIYRIGNPSALMQGLIQAARAGKQVLAVVELKARFDEEANINWAERLEAAGVQVVYGMANLKTHAKMLLINRREAGKTIRYVHLSTGNYNAQTARLYTDLSLMTAHAGITHDAQLIFQQLAGFGGSGKARVLRHMLQAPYTLHKSLIQKLERLTEAAQMGQEARVILKLNALTDAGLIAALLRAAHAGAQVDLVVRGACTLPLSHPLLMQAQGQSVRIRVRSVVGRFLEHTRLIYLEWGTAPEEQALYLSSADWMGRNLFGRVEIAWPILDVTLRQRVLHECLEPYLRDTEDSWWLQSDGSYRRAQAEQKTPHQKALGKCSAQKELLERLVKPKP